MYTAWANSCLKDSSVRITDIRKDLVDGVTLIKLLTALTDNKDKIKALKYAENPKNQFQVNINLNLAMKFMKEVDKVHIVFIDANDTLALMWTLILHYHYGSTINDIVEAKKLLLGWLKAILPERNITNFNKDWMDGWNLIALINKFLPDQIGKNWNDKSDIDRVAEALKVADERLGIPQIIDASDVCTEQHDDRSIVSYIIYFCNKDSVGQNALMKWIQEKIPECGISNFTTDWSDGTALGSLAHAVSGGNFPQHKEMSPSDPIANFTSSIQFATTLGIPEIVTPQELADPNLDPLTLVTYLTYFPSAQVPIEPTLPQDIHNLASIDLKVVVSGFGSIPINVNVTDSNGSVVVNEENEIKEDKHIMSYNNMTSESYTIEVAVKPPQDEPSISLITIVAFGALLFSVLLM
jgi:filamin